MTERNLFIPVNSNARDMYGAILLAAVASEQGWRSIIGKKRDLDRLALGGLTGVYFLMGLPKKNWKFLKKLKDSGSKLVVMTEGGLVTPRGMAGPALHYGVESGDLVDLIFSSGPFFADNLIAFMPQLSDKIILTGHPRFDSLLPPGNVIYGRKEKSLGKLVVNTNFPLSNPPEWREIKSDMARRGKILTIEDEKIVHKAIELSKAREAGLKSLLLQAKENGLIKAVTIRPHPSENQQVWKDWSRRHGFDFDAKGSAITLLGSSEKLLHTGCTTGIEAVIMGVPTASYVPEAYQHMKSPADDVSFSFSEYAEFKKFLSSPPEMPENLDKLKKLLTIDFSTGASLRILAALEKNFIFQSGRSPLPDTALTDSFVRVRTEFQEWLKHAVGIVRTNKELAIPGPDVKNTLHRLYRAGVIADVPKYNRFGRSGWVFASAR